ncbi:MAG: hypothetical protein LBD13_01585 [Spirochaetaceae bacterium]|jgi:hypothetical protein|nr:hypothetical protein [Spirochaetaceae bacterium]
MKNMKNKVFFLLGTLAAAFLVSCTTSIPVTVSHPPKMDTNGIERMTVLPFTGRGDRQQIASDLTGIFEELIGGTGVFQMVNSRGYQKGSVDAVFTGEVTKYESGIVPRDVQENTQSGPVQKTVYDRVVQLEFTYVLTRERDSIDIGKRKVSCTGRDSGKGSPSELAPADDIAKKAARYELSRFTQEIVPWTSTEKLTLDKETSKDKALKDRMKAAEKLVKGGSYKAAQDEYAAIYADTKSLAAGYNHAILAQPLESLEAAVGLLSILVNETGYAKAKTELSRLSGFLGENAAAAASTTGTSQQDLAIEKIGQGLIAALPEGSRVSLFNISKSGSERELTDVVIREITPSLIDRSITVLERGENAALIDAEKQFQSSGEVSDDSYVSIGHMLGVETIVTFSVSGSGHQRKLTVKAVSVETGKVGYNESTEL